MKGLFCVLYTRSACIFIHQIAYHDASLIIPDADVLTQMSSELS